MATHPSSSQVSLHTLEGLGLPPIAQIGFVVRSLDEAKERYGPLFGPFTHLDTTVEGADYRGQQTDVELAMMFGMSGEVEMEFIEVRSGQSPHSEFLEAGREGMHHLCYRVQDVDGWVAKFETLGYHTIWYKVFGPDMALAYMEREGDPLLVELLRMPGDPGTAAGQG
jgi:catechol 2,3-dioxygenase-like lactoylglutathione lyase family enzyme